MKGPDNVYGDSGADMGEQPEKSFSQELEALINRFSLENGSDTPDFILSDYLCECIGAFNRATNSREKWYGHKGLSETLSSGATEESPTPNNNLPKQDLNK